MSQKSTDSRLVSALLKQLSHPLKLRLALCSTMLTVWYALFFSPLSEHVAATASRVVAEHKRIKTAKDIDRLKKSLAPFRDAAGTGDVPDLIRHVMQHIRTSPLRLIDLRPDTSKDLGPFEVIGLKLNLEGTYNDLDDFLGWIEGEKRLLRINSIQVTPNRREVGRLGAQITLVALAEKPAQPAKGKAEAGKKP